MDNMDKLVDGLLAKVATEKQKLEQAEKEINTKFLTSRVFRYPVDTQTYNLNTIKEVETLTDIIAFLIGKKELYERALKALELPDTEFRYNGFTYSDWLHDIKLRVTKLGMEKTRTTILTLETELAKYLSPEQIRAKELERLSRLVDGL